MLRQVLCASLSYSETSQLYYSKRIATIGILCVRCAVCERWKEREREWERGARESEREREREREREKERERHREREKEKRKNLFQNFRQRRERNGGDTFRPLRGFITLKLNCIQKRPEKKDFIKYKQDVSPSNREQSGDPTLFSVLLRKPVRAKRPVCI